MSFTVMIIQLFLLFLVHVNAKKLHSICYMQQQNTLLMLFAIHVHVLYVLSNWLGQFVIKEKFIFVINCTMPFKCSIVYFAYRFKKFKLSFGWNVSELGVHKLARYSFKKSPRSSPSPSPIMSLQALFPSFSPSLLSSPQSFPNLIQNL